MDTPTLIALISLAVAVISTIITILVTLPKTQRWVEDQLERLPDTYTGFRRTFLELLTYVGDFSYRMIWAITISATLALVGFGVFLLYSLHFIIQYNQSPPSPSFVSRETLIAGIVAALITVFCISLIIGILLFSLYERVAKAERILKLPTFRKAIEESHKELLRLARENWDEFSDSFGKGNEIGITLRDSYPVRCQMEELTVACANRSFVDRIEGRTASNKERGFLLMTLDRRLKNFPAFRRSFTSVRFIYGDIEFLRTLGKRAAIGSNKVIFQNRLYRPRIGYNHLGSIFK